MGDEEVEKKYELYVKDFEKPREEGSQKFSGHGRAFYVDAEANPSDTYEGQFVEGFRQGKGVYVWKSQGDRYEGHYEENKKHGFGKLNYSSKASKDDDGGGDDDAGPPRGGTYLGNYCAGLRGCSARTDPAEAGADSEGTFTYVNGDVYCGQWRAGKKHGQGTYTYAGDDTKLVGQWEAGKITNGRWVFPDGTYYSGRFQYNKPFGAGVWVFRSGNQLTGEYIQKNKEAEDGAGDEGDQDEPKPDPQVWVYFKHGKHVNVRGGTMFKPTPHEPS
eukprot:TRINITY_DN24871_c2_g1_i1.p1 TRINITY_DN24871_c2_g1~~TRINITY_DN24871_c2_g1_i1.p1  ORF type:complete len:274 (-),score=39.54 TRINITY_DN24871_c2_g1_i1:189-1010(-)